jgi:hypothetical protein
LALLSNPVYHAHAKHIELDYHFIRKKVINGDISVKFISTHDQVSNIFMKCLSYAHFALLKSKLLVISPPFSLRGDVSKPFSKPLDSYANATTQQPITLNKYHGTTIHLASVTSGKKRQSSNNPKDVPSL